MWQVCPMCKGSGQVKTSGHDICPVCNGKRIINEATGLPPNEAPVVVQSPVIVTPQIIPPQPYYLQPPTIAPPNYNPTTTCGQTDAYNPDGLTGDFWK